MEGVLSEGMCRCCASEGSFKDFQVPYQWMGVEEIYSNMMKDCFDISLMVTEDGNNGGICEVCITQLRNAFNFKLQVQQTELKFKRKLEERSFKADSIKMELSRDGDDDSNMSGDFSSNDYEVPIKVEKVEDKPKKRQAAKASTSKAKKSKASPGETSTKRKRVVKSEPTSVKVKVKPEKKPTKIVLVAVKNQTDLQKHRTNMFSILQNSNATPIYGHTDGGYNCCFCKNQYVDPGELKKYNLNTHTNSLNAQDIQMVVPNDVNQLCIKLDITALICSICHENIESTEALIEHLRNTHKKFIFTDITQQILPFKFDSEGLQCHICRNTFNKFKKLMEHMNLHFRNFVCDVCDAGFICKRKLDYHKIIHKTGTFPCDQCSKIFTTMNRKRCHERQYHEKAMLVNKCGFCDALFKNNRQKDKHLETEHGIKSFARKCQACGKMFVHQNALMIHKKRHHLVERPHKCPECGKGFFSTTEVRTHMLKHTGKRAYQCDICLKTYGRKWTLHQHMRIHMDDRRYKCEICGQGFVQKCSWRGHMRSKHGEQV